MAPNLSDSDPTPSTILPSKDNKGLSSTKEIFYKGFYYDVTNFLSRHPGGNVIKFYTEQGEDATQAIDQFHFRSMTKVDLILKSLKRRPAELHEQVEGEDIDHKTSLRHVALTADFDKLFNELKAEGYFEPSIPHVIIRLLEPTALFLVTLSVFFQCETLIGKLLSTILCGFAVSRFGWVQHEGGHNSLTGNPKIDKFIQKLSFTFTMGGSSVWWNSQHNRHHAMPQRLEHDVDLAALPFVAFHQRAVKNRKEVNTFFVKYQAILYYTLDMFLVNIVWRYVLHPRHQFRKRAYDEIFLSLPNLFFVFFVIGIPWYFVIMYWATFFLMINFALSHSHLEVADKPTHWIEYSLTHTANIKPSLFVDYFMGYLNYQIEHHLFPAMPQFRQREICHRVKALAEKHGLPYKVYGYLEACGVMLKNLDDVGRELTSGKDH